MIWFAAAGLFSFLVLLLISSLELSRYHRDRDDALERARIDLQLKIDAGWRIQAMSDFIGKIWPRHIPEESLGADPTWMVLRSPSKDHRRLAIGAMEAESKLSITTETRPVHWLTVELERSLGRSSPLIITSNLGGQRIGYALDEISMLALDDIEPFVDEVSRAIAEQLVRGLAKHARREYYGPS